LSGTSVKQNDVQSTASGAFMANSHPSPEDSPRVAIPRNDDIPEKETIRQVQEGDAAAFERIYQRYSRRISGLCLRISKNQAEAEDLTQEAFLRVFRKLHSFRGESAFPAWFHRVSVNIVWMSLRKRKVMEIPLENDGDHEEEPGARHPVARTRLLY
jgi:RNA polymerase sigma-70 factor (ECF subfamily)